MRPVSTAAVLRILILVTLFPGDSCFTVEWKPRFLPVRRIQKSKARTSALLVKPPLLCNDRHVRHFSTRWKPVGSRCWISSCAKDGIEGGDRGLGGNEDAGGRRGSPEDGRDDSRDQNLSPSSDASRTAERLFAQPSAPRRREMSEGLGKGAPSPRQRARLELENLELTWRMAGQWDRSVRCRECAGEGIVECRFCDGTGMFKIGGELMLDPASGRPPPCPVCKSTGLETCKRCKGAGRIAVWLLRDGRTGS